MVTLGLLEYELLGVLEFLGPKVPLQLLFSYASLFFRIPSSDRFNEAWTRKLRLFIEQHSHGREGRRRRRRRRRLLAFQADFLFLEDTVRELLTYIQNSTSGCSLGAFEATPSPFTSSSSSSSSSSSIFSASTFVRFSESILWRIQRDFYLKESLNAWEDNIVPYEISSNRFVAKLYWQQILSLITQSFPSSPAGKPINVCVVEIGAGHGKLSYLLLEEYLKSDRDVMTTVQFICTDFHENALKTIKDLPWIHRYHPLIQYCVLDSDGFRGEEAVVENTKNYDLICVVANYAFDSFPTDLFVSNAAGEIYEIGVEEERERGSFNPPDPQYIAKGAAEDELCFEMKQHLRQFPGQIMPFSKVGVAIMTHVKLYFSSRGQQEPVFGLICGDCLVHDDEDEAWRYPELNNPLNKGTPDGINLKGLHLPFISPTPNVLAVPVHTSILKLSFQSVFEACFTFSRSTSSYPSCFSVLVLSSALSTALTSLISFSPNEYQNLCDLLTNLSFKKVQEECISLTFLWEFLTTVAANDCALLFQLLSLVRRRLRFIRTPNAASTSKRARHEHHESVRWIQNMVECSVSHYCSSWRELIQMRIKVAQWLLSMDAHDALCSFFSEEGVLSYSHSKEVTCDCLITIKAVSHMSWTSIYCLSLPEAYVAAHLYLRLLDLATAESLFTAIISRCSNNSSLMEMSTAGFTTRIKRRTIFSKTIKSIISLRARQKNSYA